MQKATAAELPKSQMLVYFTNVHICTMNYHLLESFINVIKL